MSNNVSPDWKEIKEQLAQIVRVAGAKALLKMAQAEWDAYVQRHQTIQLPPGFQFFTEDDWMGYSGCSSWLGTIEPVIGTMKVDLGGNTIDATCIISADEETREKAIISLHLYDGDDEEQNTYLTKDFGSLEEALGFVEMVKLPLSLASLQRFGFSE